MFNRGKKAESRTITVLSFLFLLFLSLPACSTIESIDNRSADKDITVAHLRALYGQPIYHRHYMKTITDTFGPVVFTYDEEIAFEYQKLQITFYFLDGKYQGRVLFGYTDGIFEKGWTDDEEGDQTTFPL